MNIKNKVLHQFDLFLYRHYLGHWREDIRKENEAFQELVNCWEQDQQRIKGEDNAISRNFSFNRW